MQGRDNCPPAPSAWLSLSICWQKPAGRSNVDSDRHVFSRPEIRGNTATENPEDDQRGRLVRALHPGCETAFQPETGDPPGDQPYHRDTGLQRTGFRRLPDRQGAFGILRFPDSAAAHPVRRAKGRRHRCGRLEPGHRPALHRPGAGGKTGRLAQLPLPLHLRAGGREDLRSQQLAAMCPAGAGQAGVLDRDRRQLRTRRPGTGQIHRAQHPAPARHPGQA
jgi:hypothetical protein